MVPEVAAMLGNMFIGLLRLVDDVFTGLNGWDFYIAGFIIFTVARFMLVPFLRGSVGGVGSDIVKKIAKESSDIHSNSRGSSDRAKGEK